MMVEESRYPAIHQNICCIHVPACLNQISKLVHPDPNICCIKYVHSAG